MASNDTAAPTHSPTAPVTVTTSPPVTTSPAVYDTSIGVGVDANGFANLPLRPGARRFFVSSATGSDGNGCSGAQQPTTPLRTIAAARGCVQGGNGDQIMIAEGTSYAEGLTNMQAQMGYSAAYPTVIQSYDPADPTNEAKYGRAANGRRPVINTGGNLQLITCCGSNANNFLAIRGLDFNPGDKPDMIVSFVGSDSYILIENNIFRYTTLTFDSGSSPRSTNHVVRKNAFFGEWSASAHAQGLYDAGTDNLVVEDNVFWHNGWRLGVSRDEPVATGGPTIFRHPIYAQTNDNGILVRRNLFMDGSADGSSLRGNAILFTENVSIDNPIGVGVGGGVNYNIENPNGVTIEVSYNAFLGDADITSSLPRGMAIVTSNGRSGSSAHDNLIARSRNPNGVNVSAFLTGADFNQPSYMAYDRNVVYQWAAPDRVFTAGGVAGQEFPTYTNNIWDAPASGTNLNISSKTFANPYTAAQLFTALGCGDKTSCAARMVDTPELGWAAKARALLWQGYGL